MTDDPSIVVYHPLKCLSHAQISDDKPDLGSRGPVSSPNSESQCKGLQNGIVMNACNLILKLQPCLRIADLWSFH